MAYKDKVSPQVQEAIFNKLLEKQGNQECADCNTKSPSWLSLDFGVFVCIRCSGIHRQYGQHITRVRSTRLDGLPKEYIEIMAATGNKLANQYYEHNLSKGYRKPTINSSPDEVKRFMDEKYIKKAFAPKGFPEPVKEVIECRKNGTKPAFGFAKDREDTQVEKVEEAPVQHDNHRKAAGPIVRRGSMSLDKLPAKPEQSHEIDLMSQEVDLLGGNDFGDFKQARSASPVPQEKKTINFANFKKAQNDNSPQQPTQPAQNNHWAWDLTTAAPSNPQAQNTATSAVNSTTPVQTQAENKVDVMKLYSQPTHQQMHHQNHFMQGNMYHHQQQQQQWGGHMQGGYNNGWNNGMNNGGYNMGQAGGQAGFNHNMGYNQVQMNGTMGYNQVPMNGQFGNNLYQNNGYAQTAQNRYF